MVKIILSNYFDKVISWLEIIVRLHNHFMKLLRELVLRMLTPFWTADATVRDLVGWEICVVYAYDMVVVKTWVGPATTASARISATSLALHVSTSYWQSPWMCRGLPLPDASMQAAVASHATLSCEDCVDCHLNLVTSFHCRERREDSLFAGS